MAKSRKGTSPSDPSAGDDARDVYEELTDDLLYDPAIGRATMMGYPCVRLAGEGSCDPGSDDVHWRYAGTNETVIGLADLGRA